MRCRFVSRSLRCSLIFSRRNMTTRIAACQMRSNADKDRNFEICKGLVAKAAEGGAKVVFLPEGFDYIAESGEQSVAMAEPLHGPAMDRYRSLARTYDVWLSLGGFHEQGPPSDPGKLYNAHVLVDNSGSLVACYRKTHLFHCKIENQVSLKESKWCIAGSEILSPQSSPAGNIALMICYDLRFPEMSITLAKDGADILTYPSAFTVPTGQAHWETLLRARAIENQCYVVAAAQVGQHNAKRTSYGHTMIVDPWGRILAQCTDEEKEVVFAEVDSGCLSEVRSSMQVFEQRRHDLYTAVKRCS